METEQLLISAAILACGAALQGAAGFGYGMLTVPLLLTMANLPAHVAIALVVVSVTGQTVFGLYTLRKSIRWKQAMWMIACSAAVLPVGIWVQYELSEIGPERLKQVIGALILVAVIARVALRFKPRAQWPWYWGPIACAGSGFTGGLAGMGGPPIVIWVMAHTWSSDRARAAMWMLFTGVMPLQVAVLYLTYGESTLDGALNGALMWPVVIVGSLPGLWLGKRLPPRVLRGTSVVLLLVASIYVIVQPLVA